MNWLDAVSRYPNGVPRFESRAECLEFMEEYNTYNGGSNPSNPHLMHIFTMLTSWNDIEKVLLPSIRKAREEPSFSSTCGIIFESFQIYKVRSFCISLCKKNQ